MPPSRPQRRPPVGRQPRSLHITAAWAGVASALAASVIAIAVVAVLWLPASGGSGSAGSAIRAGILTFLAALHGGMTIDGVPAAFVPLGLTLLVVVIVWRAATAVAGAADELGEDRPGQLGRAIGAQSGVFALTCTALAAASPLGSSRASIVGAFFAGLVLGGVVATAAMLRHSALGDEASAHLPAWVAGGLRCAVAAFGVQLGAGAVLVAASLILHHERVMTLSREVGGGWTGVPVLVLGVLAAPNAAIAGAGYLSGAGFAVGTSTTVSLTGTTTGLVPAFPVLGALPDRGAATLPEWLLAALTALLAGAAVAVVAGRAETWRDRWTTTAAALGATAVLGAILAWQGGGGIGSGKLHAVGTSPWRFALLGSLWTMLAATALLGLRAAVTALRDREAIDRPTLRETFAALTSVEDYGHDDANGDDDDDHDDDDHDDHGIDSIDSIDSDDNEGSEDGEAATGPRRRGDLAG